MSFTVKKAATVLSLSVIATVLTVACAAAQGGASVPTGGNRLQVATEDGRGLGPVGFMSRQFSLPVSWQGAFGSFVASQYATSYLTRTSSVPVVTRRTIAKR